MPCGGAARSAGDAGRPRSLTMSQLSREVRHAPDPIISAHALRCDARVFFTPCFCASVLWCTCTWTDTLLVGMSSQRRLLIAWLIDRIDASFNAAGFASGDKLDTECACSARSASQRQSW